MAKSASALLKEQFAAAHKKEEKTEKKFADMTDAEKLKVKSKQLREAKATIKEQKEYIEFLEKNVDKLAVQVSQKK